MLQLQAQMLFLYYNKETKDRKRDRLTDMKTEKNDI